VRGSRLLSAGGLAVVISLVLAQGALAGGARNYSGAVVGDDATTVSLKLKKREGRLWLTAFVARNFVIACDSGVQARLGSAAVKAVPGAIPVRRKGHFQAKVEKGPKTVELNGRLAGRDAASGTLHYSGLTTVMVGGSEESLDCNSQLLDWEVARSPHTTGRMAASMP
jgi:hypothetical protein